MAGIRKGKGYSLKVLPGRGRALIAERDYVPGDIVLEEEPCAFVICDAYTEVGCAYCAEVCMNKSIFATSPSDKARYAKSCNKHAD